MEAFQFYNAMLHNKCSRHEAIQLLMTILIKFLFPVLKGGETFDLDGYRKLLRVYKTRKPDRIIALLESEPVSPATEEVDGEKSQIFDELRYTLKGQAFESIDVAQAFAEMWMREKNAEPLSDFLGLSPEQMHRILYRPFTETSDIVRLNKDLSIRGEILDERGFTSDDFHHLLQTYTERFN